MLVQTFSALTLSPHQCRYMGAAKTNQYWFVFKFQSCLSAELEIWFSFIYASPCEDDLLKQ